MENKSILKLLAGSVIYESNLTKSSKKQMLNFIQHENTTDSQLKALLLDGEICSIDKQSEEIIKERFKISEYNDIIQEAGVVGNIVGIAITVPMGGPAIWAKWRIINALFSKASRRCGIFRISNQRDACIAKARIDINKKKINLIKAVQSKECKQAKNPLKCKEKAEKSIIKFKGEISKQNEKLIKLAGKGRVAKTPGEKTKLV